MKLTTKFLSVATAVALGASALCLAGCDEQQVDGTPAPNTSGVAATMGDEVIYEDEVTEQIETIRSYYGYTDDSTWALFLMLYGLTPETLRETIIQNLVYSDVVVAAAKAEGVTVPAAELDAAVSKMKDTYGMSDADWATALASAGYTTESYRAAVEASMLESLLKEKIVADENITDEVIEQYGMETVDNYFNTMKRSSHILFAADNAELAQQVLDQIQSGEITFEDALAIYSQKDSGALEAGDVGWDGVTTFVTEYQTALDGMEEGQVVGLVTTEYGVHIIKCTEVFTYTEATTAADLPEVLRSYLVTNVVKSALWNDYIAKARETLGFEVTAMPSGLSYDVDASSVIATSTSVDQSAAASGEGTASGEAATTSGEGTTASSESTPAE